MLSLLILKIYICLVALTIISVITYLYNIQASILYYVYYIGKKRKHIVREKNYVYCRSYRNYNKDIFQRNLRKLDWSILDLLDNVDDMWSMIYKAINYEVNLMCPYKRIKNICQ